MMIRIGQTLVKEEDISAVYPSVATPGKVWLALQNGRTVWAHATMPEAVEAITGDDDLAGEFETDEYQRLVEAEKLGNMTESDEWH